MEVFFGLWSLFYGFPCEARSPVNVGAVGFSRTCRKFTCWWLARIDRIEFAGAQFGIMVDGGPLELHFTPKHRKSGWLVVTSWEHVYVVHRLSAIIPKLLVYGWFYLGSELG